MLHLLGKYPFLSSKHLYWMVPETDSKAFYQIKNGQQRCNERIRHLFDRHFIYKFSPRLPPGKGTAPQYVMLDRAGLKFLNIKRRPAYYNDLELPRHFYHTIAVLDTIAGCYKAHREGNIELKLVEYEPLLKNTTLKPDAIIAYTKNNKAHFHWIELDRNEKSIEREEEKIKALEEFNMKMAWKDEHWNRSLQVELFPKITYIVEPKSKQSSRIEQLKKALNKTNLNHEVMHVDEWMA